MRSMWPFAQLLYGSWIAYKAIEYIRHHILTCCQPTYPINICEEDERANSYNRFLVHNVEFLGDSSGEETRSKKSCTSLGDEAGRRGKTVNNFGGAFCWWWWVGAHRTTAWMALIYFPHEAEQIDIRRDGPSDSWHRARSGYRNELVTVLDRKVMQPAICSPDALRELRAILDAMDKVKDGECEELVFRPPTAPAIPWEQKYSGLPRTWISIT